VGAAGLHDGIARGRVVAVGEERRRRCEDGPAAASSEWEKNGLPCRGALLNLLPGYAP
jgi:hypothetical protein